MATIAAILLIILIVVIYNIEAEP